MTASQPHGEATDNGMQQNSNFYKFQEEPRRTSSPRSRRRKGKKVPKREQMMGEDGLSSLQTHLQEVAQPVQAHGQGQRMGERPTPNASHDCSGKEQHPKKLQIIQTGAEDEVTREIEVKTEPEGDGLHQPFT